MTMDYEKIRKALENEATGSFGEARVESQTISKNGFDDKGNHTQQTQINTVKRPNVPLALKLLDECIGGPQDWC